MPAKAMIPNPDMTIPNGRPVIHSPSKTPPIDSIIADIVTKVCQNELNWIIRIIIISSNDNPNA